MIRIYNLITSNSEITDESKGLINMGSKQKGKQYFLLGWFNHLYKKYLQAN